MNQDDNQELEHVYSIHYSINSGLNFMDDKRYNIQITGKIIASIEEEDENITEVHIGDLNAYKLFIETARIDGFEPFDVYDYHHETITVGKHLWDFKKDEWLPKVRNYFEDEFYNSDLLILDTIEIIEEYRGQGIGKRVIKDLYNNFISGCSLFALESFPLQHSGKLGHTEIDFDIDDPEAGANITDFYAKSPVRNEYFKDAKRLIKYFKSIGFEQISGIDHEILVISPFNENEVFKQIELT